MIYKKSIAEIKKRMSLIKQTFNKIDNIPEASNFSREIFQIIASFGLQIPAKEKGLFTYDNQVNPELNQEELKNRIKKFLFKHIR